jgi:hypothetical protein
MGYVVGYGQEGCGVLFRGLCTVLPRGLNFGRKPHKGPTKIVWGRENLRPNLWQIYQKRAKKGPNFFVVWFALK